jgi:AraC family transcriptional regulator
MLADTDRMRFTFNGSGMADYPAGATFGPRTLRDFEFVWIIAGDVQWEVDGQIIPAPPGTVLLARPGQTDGFRWDPRSRTRHGFFHFHLHQHGALLPAQSQWPLSRLLNENDILRPLFHHLGWLLGRDDAVAKEQAQGVMRQALVAYLSGLLGTTGEHDRPGHPLVEGALSYVQERWKDGDLAPITLGDLARATDVSKAHLTRIFQATLGVSPVEALRQLRLDRAVTFAEATGFPNPFHFSKVFSSVYGSSPRAFRQGIARGETPALIKLVRTRGLADHLWR